jgi:hypothetical protein
MLQGKRSQGLPCACRKVKALAFCVKTSNQSTDPPAGGEFSEANQSINHAFMHSCNHAYFGLPTVPMCLLW